MSPQQSNTFWVRSMHPGDSIEVREGVRAGISTAMAAGAFLGWDICITIGDEVQQIWNRPWTLLKFLYFFLRYFSLFVIVLDNIIALCLDGTFTFSTRACYIWVGFQGLSSQLLQMGVQTLLIMRLHALYDKNIFLRRLLSLLFCAETFIMTFIFAMNITKIEFGSKCAVLRMPLTALGFFAPPILFETLLFGLTMAKFYQALRDGWGHEPVMSRFMKDGIWVFALPFVSTTVNMCCMIILRDALQTIVFSWVLVIAGFAGYRLILNMSHLLRTNYHQESLMPDTVPEMFDEETRYRHYRSTIYPQDQLSTIFSGQCTSDDRTL